MKMSFIIPKPKIQPDSLFPYWVFVKEGLPILFEADFPATIGFKWGTFVDGTGTVTKDTNHSWGGDGSVKMSTQAVINSSAELKTNLNPRKGRIAFECKWGQESPTFGGVNFDMGIEPRVNDANGFWQGRMRWTANLDKWKIETGVDSYEDLDPIATLPDPDLDASAGQAGDQWGWARLVIDATKKEYVSFEILDNTGYRKWNLEGTPLVNRGSATRDNLLIFTLVRTPANGVEEAFTTDWCISQV